MSPVSLVDAVLPLASSPVLYTDKGEMEDVGGVQRPEWRWWERFAYAVGEEGRGGRGKRSLP